MEFGLKLQYFRKHVKASSDNVKRHFQPRPLPCHSTLFFSNMYYNIVNIYCILTCAYACLPHLYETPQINSAEAGRL